MDAGLCYRVVKPVELGPVLAVLDRLQFVYVNQGGTDTSRYACSVVLQDKFPQEIRDFISGLQLGGKTARAILRRLEPRQSIPPHTDTWMPAEANWKRYQVPLVSHPDIRMRWPDDNVEVHLEPGFVYEVRFDRMHEVVNSADIQRVHLQIDQMYES
jgi:hypothetical protein